MPARAAASVSVEAGVAAKPIYPPNQRHFASNPVDLAVLNPVRQKATAALQRARDKRTRANDSMAALASALSDAPGSAVLALELEKAARRAHDRNRESRFRRIVERSLDAFPVLDRPTASANLKRRVATPFRGSKTIEGAASLPTQKLSGVENLDKLCGWLIASFRQGHPPVDDVGEQSTNSLECQETTPQSFSHELLAETVTVRVGDVDQRVFAWVAVQFKASVWLSPVVAESFAPAPHPHGNGFAVELQRAEAFRGGLPELTAYVTDRSTVIDVVLNEIVVEDRHHITVMTFDGDVPQTSSPILLHSRVSRGLADSSDAVPPKGYRHSPDLGTTSEVSFRLEWAENAVRLTSSASSAVETRPLFSAH